MWIERDSVHLQDKKGQWSCPLCCSQWTSMERKMMVNDFELQEDSLSKFLHCRKQVGWTHNYVLRVQPTFIVFGFRWTTYELSGGIWRPKMIMGRKGGSYFGIVTLLLGKWWRKYDLTSILFSVWTNDELWTNSTHLKVLKTHLWSFVKSLWQGTGTKEKLCIILPFSI